jgi:histidyl-tRNA synthetase
METLFTYLDAMQMLDYISFDFSLARGLDYYTGVIYEAVLTDTDRVGSISGGGRYDGLIGMFSGKSIPSVGGSIGIERIFNILEEIMLEKGDVRATETEILVTSMGKNLTAKRLEALALLWRNDIKAETLYVENPRTDKSFNYAFDNGIPLILILGEQEIANGIYKIKSLNENKEYEVKFDELVSKVQELSAANPYLLPKDGDGQIIQNANLGQIKPKQAGAP